jgi:hypothetical protein
MSQENVEIVRRAYEAFNQGDLEGMVADFAPGFEFLPTGAVPGAGARVRGGPEGWRELVNWFWAEFDDAGAEIDELTEAGDKVLAEVTLQGRGKQSGVEATWHLWHLWVIEDGQVAYGQGFMRRAEALEAAGLGE